MPTLNLLPQTSAAVDRRVQTVHHVRAVRASGSLHIGATDDTASVVVMANTGRMAGRVAETGTANTADTGSTGSTETAIVVVARGVARSGGGARVRGMGRVVVVVVRQTGTGNGTSAASNGRVDVVLVGVLVVGSGGLAEIRVDRGVELVHNVVLVGAGGVGSRAGGRGLGGWDVGGRVDAADTSTSGGVLAVIGMNETHDEGCGCGCVCGRKSV